VQSLGGKRRRGAGSINVKVDATNGAGQNLVVDHAITLFEDTQVPPDFAIDVVEQAQPAVDSSDEWTTLELRLTTLDPVLMPSTVLGNVIEGRATIPGAALLGAIVGRSGIDLGSLIATQALVVTEGTPEINGHRSAVVPRAFVAEKGSGGLGVDEGLSINTLRGARPGGQYRRHPDGFVGIDDKPRAVKPTLTTRAHNRVDDQTQRPGDDALFTLQVIPERTVLRSQVHVRHGAIANTLRTALHQSRVTVGSKAKGGYGTVSVEVVSPGGHANRPGEPTTDLTVWCISDVLIRDEYLRFDPTPARLQSVLEQRLGVTLTAPLTGERASALAVSRSDSWQQQWGLPRPTLFALAAGSCARYVADRPITPAQLVEIERSGIGERCAEGFGQLRFNPSILATDEVTGGTLLEDDEPVPTDGAVENELVRYEALRRLIEREAERLARTPNSVISIPDAITRAQIGTLRALTETVRKVDDLQTFDSWAQGEEGRARSPWKDALPAIRAISTNTNWVWDKLNLTVTLSPEEAQGLRPSATRLLLSATFRNHQRERRSN
jgi:CRISPR-associated protein Csx10